MEFTFRTVYDQKATTAMARALRKTIRKKHSRRSHVFGWIVVVLTIMLMISAGIRFDVRTIVTGGAVAFLLAALVWEDRINGWVARKRMLPGMSDNTSVFGDEGYHTENPVGKTDWSYGNIDVIAEDDDYFAFIFGKNHAQVYDKSSISGGTADEFRTFIKEKTGLEVNKI